MISQRLVGLPRVIECRRVVDKIDNPQKSPEINKLHRKFIKGHSVRIDIQIILIDFIECLQLL